jgi:RNA polymerase sigma-70 factor (ECF subfamily)
MLTRDACFSMPPLASWYGGEGGPEEMAAFLKVGPLSGEWPWRHIRVQANGQPTLGFYCYYEPEGAHIPFALNVLTLEDDKISDITAFCCRSIEADDRAAYGRWPDEPPDRRRLEDFFVRFGLPARLD